MFRNLIVVNTGQMNVFRLKRCFSTILELLRGPNLFSILLNSGVMSDLTSPRRVKYCFSSVTSVAEKDRALY